MSKSIKKDPASVSRFTTVNVYDVILQAARNTRLLTITYIDAKGSVSSRSIEPYEVKEDKLYGYCHKAQGIRSFKLSHIHNAIVEPHQFNPRFPILI